MAYNLKEDWPILAIGLVAVLGLVLIMSSKGGGSTQTLSSGGLTGSEESSLLSAENESAAQIQEAQIAASEQSQSNVAGLIADVVNNDAANSQDSLEAQVQEYEAYESLLGSEFGDSTNLTASTTSSNDSLEAELAQVQEQQQTTTLAYIMGLLGSLGSNATSVLNTQALAQAGAFA